MTNKLRTAKFAMMEAHLKFALMICAELENEISAKRTTVNKKPVPKRLTMTQRKDYARKKFTEMHMKEKTKKKTD